MPGGRLPETKNKRIYQISGPKSGHGRLQESFWNSVWLRNQRIIWKVVAKGGGRLREVVALREFTVLTCAKSRENDLLAKFI